MFLKDDLSYSKIASQSHAYVGTSYDAGNAVDGNIATCMRTRVIGIGPTPQDRKMWWKVDLGGLYTIYNINIQFKNYGEDLGVFYKSYHDLYINYTAQKCLDHIRMNAQSNSLATCFSLIQFARTGCITQNLNPGSIRTDLENFENHFIYVI